MKKTKVYIYVYKKLKKYTYMFTKSIATPVTKDSQ